MNLGRTAYKLDGAPVSTGEVLAGSLIGGWLRPFEQRLRNALAAQALAAEEDEEVSEQAIEDALDAWRAERDLIAAEELERWLESRELSIEELCDHLERSLLADRPRETEDLARLAPEPEEVHELVAAEAAFTGDLERLAWLHARRAVAPAPGDDEATRLKVARVSRDILGECNADDDAGLEDAVAAMEVEAGRVPWLLGVEVAYRLFAEEALSFGRLKDALTSFRDELVRYEVMLAECPTDDVAREVMCCIRVDHDPFTRSVARAGLACRKEEVFAAQCATLPFGAKFLSAHARDVFGPGTAAERHAVVQLVEKREPDLSNPVVVEWLSERLVDRALRKPMNARVRFPEPGA